MSIFSHLSLLFLVFLICESNALSLLMIIMCLYVYVLISMTLYCNYGGLSGFLSSSLLFVLLIYFSTSSLWIFYLCFEFSLVPISIVILLLGYQPENLTSSLYLLIYTVVCSLPLFLHSVSSNSDIYCGLSSPTDVTSCLLSLSFMVKSPLYSLHSWLPKAHVEAPLLGSILLSGVLLKIGGYGLMLILPSSFLIFHFYLYLSLLGGLVCSVLCYSSWDMKSVIAYSSVVHIGVVTIGVLSCLERGYWVATGIIIAHSLVSPMLFGLSHLLYSSTFSRAFVHGLNSPISSSLFLILAVYCGLNLSLPPSLAFWLEVSLFSLIGSIFVSSSSFLVATAFLCFLFSMWFYVRAVSGMASAFVVPVYSPFPFLPSIFFSFIMCLVGACFLT